MRLGFFPKDLGSGPLQGFKSLVNRFNLNDHSGSAAIGTVIDFLVADIT